MRSSRVCRRAFDEVTHRVWPALRPAGSRVRPAVRVDSHRREHDVSHLWASAPDEEEKHTPAHEYTLSSRA